MSTPRIIVQAQEFVTRVFARGLRGERGQGVIPGGAQGQILGKRSGDDYDTEWLNPGEAPSLVNTVTATAPVTSTGGVNPVIGITPATLSAPGSMSAADKAKLDLILQSSAPPAVAASSQAGASTRAAREDHTHAHGAQAGGTLHTVATGGVGGSAGFMSVSDKNKLDSIQAGAQVNVATNLGIGGTGNARQITSSTGTAATLPIATQTAAGVMSVEDKAKLDGIAPGATVYTNTIARGQVEAMLIAGANVTLTYSGSGASRTVTISASGGGGGGSGTVTSVQASGGSTGLTFTGGPITIAGTLTLGGTLGIANGGTGATTAEGARAAIGAGTGNGTVTSVGLSLPSIFSVSSSPVTGAGTITATLASQTASRVWASPAGSDGAPTFRELVQGDIPALSASKIVLADDRLLGQVAGGSAATQIALGTGLSFVATTLTLSANLQGWHALAPSSKQDTLVSGANIRTINGNTLLGSTDLVIATGATTLDGLTDVTITSVSNGQVLTYNSGTSQWVNATPSGGGGLTHFTESVNTSAPNATIPAVQLIAANAATSVDVVISWKGPSGALMVQIPDNTTAGGNKRGSGAIDFQSSRSAATQVASGTRAAILSGSNNTNSSTNGGILGGTSNTLSSSAGAITGGQSNTVSNANAFCGAGLSNTVSGNQAGVVCGVSNQATAQRAFVGGGAENQATGESSWIPGGAQSSTRGLFGAYSWSGARRSSNFDNQCIGLPVQRGTTDATPTILTADRGAPSTTNVMVLPNNSCWTGTVHITGRSSGAAVYYLRLDVVGARGANAAATTVKATNPAYTFTDIALVGVSAAVVANTTRGSLEVEVTGLAATTIDWFAHFDAGNQIVR